MRKNSEVCLICGKNSFKNANGFTKHLRVHKISSENYYLFYIDYNAGICKCGKPIKFSGIDKGFPKLCRECNNKRNPERIKKIKQTMLYKYGADNASKIEKFKDKRKQTNLERYGVEYATSNPDIMKRCTDTWEKNYKEGHPGKNQKIKEKKKNTCLKKYKVENPSQVEEFKNKRKQTTLKRYGVEYAMSNPKIRKKFEDTFMKKYEVKHALQVPEIVEKISGPNSYRWIEDREQRFAPYTEKFLNLEYRLQIRKEQKNLDPLTDKPLLDNAHLHHIDYNKQNDSRENLIFLNRKSHFKTNTNREEWLPLLQKINQDIISGSPE